MKMLNFSGIVILGLGILGFVVDLGEELRDLASLREDSSNHLVSSENPEIAEIQEYIDLFAFDKSLNNEGMSQSARIKYFKVNAENKYMRITGSVRDINRSSFFVPLSVKLEFLNDEFEGTGDITVVCFIENVEFLKQIESLKIGDQFTCDGQVEDYILLVGTSYNVTVR